jgi:hypothetical protein
MADGDASLHAERAGAFDDQLQAEGAEQAGFVQVDIDRLAELLGQAEHHVQMAFRVAVDGAGIEAADQVRAHAHRLFQQGGDARADQQAGLREGDDLDVHDIGIGVAGGEHALHPAEADGVVDIDMAADMRGAHAQRLHHLTGGLPGRVDIPGDLQPPLGLDLVDQARPGLVRPPAHAPERLVQVRVRFHQPGDQQRAAAPLLRHAGRLDRRADRRDPPLPNEQVDQRAPTRPDIPQHQRPTHGDS